MGKLQLLFIDDLSLIFGTLFILVALAAFIYGFNTAKHSEYIAALIYIGAALSVVFSNDFISLYIFWELMALSSVFLILLRNTAASQKAGLRYIIVHLVGGLVLLAGIILHIHHTGSIDLQPITLHSLSSYLILIGVLVNAAAVPFSSWLTDAYPESTVMGGVILSSVTTKSSTLLINTNIFRNRFINLYRCYYGYLWRYLWFIRE